MELALEREWDWTREKEWLIGSAVTRSRFKEQNMRWHSLLASAHSRRRVNLPPGRYYVGDPCYPLRSVWDDYLNVFPLHATTCTHYMGGVFVKLPGEGWEERAVVSFDTFRGDGVYFDGDGFSYPVDSGLLGVVRLPEEGTVDGVEDGRVLTFPTPFTVSNTNRVFSCEGGRDGTPLLSILHG